jgi:hypothetical protein
MRDLVASWENHGVACLERLAKNDPRSFARLAAMIVMRELNIDAPDDAWERSAEDRARANEELHEKLSRMQFPDNQL